MMNQNIIIMQLRERKKVSKKEVECVYINNFFCFAIFYE